MLTLVGRLLGLFVLLLGLGLLVGGVYLGIWEMLVGGIIDIINQVKAPSTDAGTVAWAIVKIIFFELPIVVGFWLGIILMTFGGTALFHKSR
jgi:hypothetical protein